MIFLTCASKLASLRKLLSQSLPESLKVYGALHYVINNNPFRLQVLVDRWPDFTSVICRPLLEVLSQLDLNSAGEIKVYAQDLGDVLVNESSHQTLEMKDPLDPYINTYFVFSKDPPSLSHMLQDPQAVNWSQKFQIQGCQVSLEEVFHTVTSKHGGHMETVSNVLYARDKKISADEVEALCNMRTSDLQFSPLHPDEAPLVSEQWLFGGNKHSENYIRQCIQTFPTLCVRKSGVPRPIAWVLSEQSSEIRMGYTESTYRSQRLFGAIGTRLIALQQSRGAPIYCHVATINKKSQSATMAIGFIPVGRWQQWTFQPN